MSYALAANPEVHSTQCGLLGVPYSVRKDLPFRALYSKRKLTQQLQNGNDAVRMPSVYRLYMDQNDEKNTAN